MIKIIFTGSNWAEIEAQLRSYRTPSAAPADPTPEIDDIEEGRARFVPDKSPEPAPEPKAKRGRPRLPTIPEIIAATEPPVSAPEPATIGGTSSPLTPREVPTLDVLKATVTQAVRQAQKKEGPAKILELLPAFKAKTGLEYIMNSEEKHREALFDLVKAAGEA